MLGFAYYFAELYMLCFNFTLDTMWYFPSLYSRYHLLPYTRRKEINAKCYVPTTKGKSKPQHIRYIFNIDKTMDWELEDERLSVFSNIQC